MKQTLIIVGLLLGLIGPVQTQTLNQYLKAAHKAYDEKDYFNTLKYLYHVQEYRELSSEDLFYLAESARRFNAYSVAKEAYEKVIASPDVDKYPGAYYNLALAEKNLGNYDAAIKHFETFLKQDFQEKSWLDARKIAAQEIDYCKWAREKVNTSNKKYELINLSDSVNTPQSELSPVIFEDKLYFSSLRVLSDIPTEKSLSRIMYMKPDSSTYFAEEFNTEKLSSAHISFTADGQRAFYTICEYVNISELRCTIHQRKKQADGSWGPSTKLPEPINMKGYTSTHPNPGKDMEGNDVLYFVSNRPGGQGGQDIYYAVMMENDFGAIKNMEAANTLLDDITPLYHENQKALYFSSKGHKGLGGFDVFKLPFDQPDSLIHLDAQINTSFDDLSYYLSPDEKKSFLSSNRLNSRFIDPTNEACCNDIWEVSIRYVDLNVLTYNAEDSSDLTGVKANLVLMNDTIQSVLNKDGIDHRFALDFEKEYQVEVSKLGFKKAYVDVNTLGLKKSIDKEEKVYLEPVIYELNANILDLYTKYGVNGATVKLYDCDGKLIDQQTFADNHVYNFKLEPDECYKLITSHPEYISDTLEFNTPPLGYEDYILNEDIILEPIPVTKLTLDGYLPLPLFFENDMPDKRSKKVTTDRKFPDLVNEYLSNRSEYVEGFARGKSNKAQARAEVNEFFDEVASGAETFGRFSEHLLRFLKQGNTAELMVRAFASPRASEEYNFALTERRIASIMNHFRVYKGGVLLEYVESGDLKITLKPYGESQAPKDVSDDLDNRSESVYSPKASRERRVEIIELKSELN